jgi:DNA-binding SARP family transcriptional activator
MAEGSINNKIAAPRIVVTLQRERLFRSLDQGRQFPLVWLSGPGGAGKTTLAASYLEARSLQSLWYQIDESDADLASFFFHLGLAARQAAPCSTLQLPLLSMEYLADLSVFTRRFFDQLYQQLSSPFIIVLDDYQQLPGSSPLQALLRGIITAVPAGITFLVISRYEPPAEYARLLANQVMHVINGQEIRFDLDDAREMITLRCGMVFPEQAVMRLHRKAEGWAAGLVLLIEHLRREKGDLDFLDHFTPARVADYFASEVYDQLDNHTREFLLKTAFLPRITVPLAEQLTSSPHCRLILSTLARNNYFTTLLQGVDAYQYHQLFRDFLRDRAAVLLPAVKVREIRKRSAELLAEAGFVEDAGVIYGELADWVALAAMALHHAPQLIAQGRNQLLDELLTRLPAEIVAQDPWLLFWLGCANMTKGYAVARKHLENAFPLLDERRDATGAYLAWSGIVDTIVNEWAEFERLDVWIEALYRLRKSYPEFPSVEIEGRVAGSILGALMFHLPQHPDIDTWAERIFTLVKESSDPATRIISGHTLVLYYLWWSGNHTRLGLLMDLLRPPSQGDTLLPLPRVIWVTLEGLQHWVAGRGFEGQKSFHQGLAIAAESGVHVYDFMLYFLGIISYLDEGDFRNGGHYIKELFSMLDRSQHLNVAHCQYVAAWQAVLEGDVDRAREHVTSGLEIAMQIGGPFTLASVWAAWTHVLYLDGRLDEASIASEQGIQMARDCNCQLLVCRNLMVKAFFAFQHSDLENGLAALREGMSLASRMRFMNFSWWHRAIMTELCQQALASEIEVDYVRELIRLRRLIPERPPLHLENWPWTIKLEMFGTFRIICEEEPVSFSGKVQKKPLELLKALVTLGGRESFEGELTDLIWPEVDGDAARISLKTTIHRLRQLIGCDEVVTVREGRVMIDRRYLYADIWAFEHFLDEAGRIRDLGREAEAELLTEKALSLYQGDFLPGDEASWVLPQREKLAQRYSAGVRLLGRKMLEQGDSANAISCFRQGLAKNPLCERLYQGLIESYLAAGDYAEATAVYQQCKKKLATNLGKPLSAATEMLLERI